MKNGLFFSKMLSWPNDLSSSFSFWCKNPMLWKYASKINFIQIIRPLFRNSICIVKTFCLLAFLYHPTHVSNLFSHPSISVCPFRAILREMGQWILHVLVKMTGECKRSNSRQTSRKIPLIHVENKVGRKTLAIVVKCSFPETFSSLRCAFKQRIRG